MRPFGPALWLALLLAPCFGGTASAGEKTLWDAWYTVAVGKKQIPYGAYNDVVRVKDGKLFFRNNYRKKEEGFINEEQLGTVSEMSENLKPLFFNFRSQYRASEVLIDGNVASGSNVLTVKMRKSGGPSEGTETLPGMRRTLPSTAFFEQTFPIWLGSRLKKLKPGDSMSFLSIVESDPDQGFGVEPGRVRLEQSDDFALRTRTKKLTVEYRDRKTVWWVAESGQLEKLEIPSQDTVILRVPKAKAEAFLTAGEGK